jgi:23S rRNA (adenine1618-N6)-methyltransferase
MNPEKTDLHPRNKHRFGYNFKQLIASFPDLASFVSINKYQVESINFADPLAVKTLNTALLKHFYEISYWDIPKGYLCPPIPGRVDYIHYMADLLASCNNGNIPTGNKVHVLDIGTGANLVYPLIGYKEYGWNFTGTDIDADAIQSAKKIISKNLLTTSIKLKYQSSPEHIYTGMIKKDERVDFTICNPPFHASAEEAMASSLRKVSNLTSKKIHKPVLNFGGQQTELWYPGGEIAFISKMIQESAHYPENCLWYSTLVSKKSNLASIYRELKEVQVYSTRTIDMTQGQKISRIVAWTFLSKKQQNKWQASRW